MYRHCEIYLYYIQLIARTLAGLHLIGRIAGHLGQFAEGIILVRAAFHAHRDDVGLDRFGDFEMDIAKTLFSLAAPDELLAGIDFKRIALASPSVELDADIVYGSRFLQPVRNPRIGQSAVAFP